MYHKNIKIITKLLLLILLTFSCRTMKVMQTADTLKPDEQEANIGFAVSTAHFNVIQMPPTGFSTEVSAGYLHRFGIKENFEIQLYLSSQLSVPVPYSSYISPFPGMTLVFQNHLFVGLKKQLYDHNNNHFSVNPFFGLYFGNINIIYPSPYPMTKAILGPELGINFIGSTDLKKDPDVSVYYGGSIEIRENLMPLAQIGSPMGMAPYSSYPFMDIEMSSTIGWEFRKNFIARHEIDLGVFIDLGYIGMPFPMMYSITMAYSCSLGFRYIPVQQ
jgi:hypothetical protein